MTDWTDDEREGMGELADAIDRWVERFAPILFAFALTYLSAHVFAWAIGELL